MSHTFGFLQNIYAHPTYVKNVLTVSNRFKYSN